tara:strand:- start:572 stop:817 length:246 start_codon:yes stop_codon:yes gene_type:complete
MVEKKEDLDVLDEIMVATILSKAECQLSDPIIEKPYYLYQRSDSTGFISLVEQEYWDYNRFKINFIATVFYTSAGTWELKP